MVGRTGDNHESPKHFNKGLKEMERLCDKSVEHMYREFKKHYDMNMTSSQFIGQMKTNYGSNLLKTSDMDIMDVALEAGFENLSYFHKQFKRYYKKTPYQFRKEFNAIGSISR
ncbi:MAG: helix-turn-helix transcriptional regulator [Clostridiales bacterium]|nr:helix-turn-helix transcriptional regulator [Clostridiales bacterium]